MRTVHSIHRTLAAMFHGWLVCNAVFFAGTLAMEAIDGKTPEGALVLLFYSSVFSLFPITAAGLLVVLPVDLALAKSSPWRRPGRACLLGAAAGLTSISLPVWVLTAGRRSCGSRWPGPSWRPSRACGRRITWPHTRCRRPNLLWKPV